MVLLTDDDPQLGNRVVDAFDGSRARARQLDQRRTRTRTHILISARRSEVRGLSAMESAESTDPEIGAHGWNTKLSEAATVNDANNWGCSRNAEDLEGRVFLADEPLLRNLLCGIPIQESPVDIACTINRLIFYYVMIKRISFEVWWFVGDGPCTAWVFSRK